MQSKTTSTSSSARTQGNLSLSAMMVMGSALVMDTFWPLHFFATSTRSLWSERRWLQGFPCVCPMPFWHRTRSLWPLSLPAERGTDLVCPQKPDQSSFCARALQPIVMPHRGTRHESAVQSHSRKTCPSRSSRRRRSSCSSRYPACRWTTQSTRRDGCSPDDGRGTPRRRG